MNFAAIAALPIRTARGSWYRAIQPQYWKSLLNTTHTSTIRTRFNPGNAGFEIFYTGENHLVALLEVRALLGTPMTAGVLAPSPLRRQWGILNVRVNLSKVVDLTTRSVQRQLRTSAQELTGDWEGYYYRNQMRPVPKPFSPAPTQRLGRELFQRGDVEAFITYSAKLAHHKVLVVLPQRIRPSSRIVFRDPITGKALSLP